MRLQPKNGYGYNDKVDKIVLDDYVDAINSVLWYNGLWSYVKKWKNLSRENGYVSCPNHYGLEESCPDVEAQLQVIWMIAVSLFGDYGTSPRFGWICNVNWDLFCKWIDDICGDCEKWENNEIEGGE